MIIFDRDEFIIARISDTVEIIEIEELHGENRLTLKLPADIPESVHALPGNFVGLLDMDGNFQVYEINDAHTISQPERDILLLQCDHLFYELATEKIKTLTFTNVSAGFAINQILLGTRWAAGTIDDLGLRTGTTFEENPLKALYTAAELWGGELRFRLAIDILHMILNIPGGHPLSVHSNDLFS
ncbi:MAG: phage tail protein [Firmicutes bacterium]|nr:phage tail protein [Bacillota bacterium]